MQDAFESRYHAHEDTHWWSVARRDMILRLLDARGVDPDAGVLDVGCASGRLVADLRARGHARVTGVDISAEAIAACRARGLDDVHCMPADRLAFDDATYDVLVASDVLEHIEDDAAALAEWRRVTRPGGLLLIFVPAHMYLWSQHDVVNHHYRRYDRRTLVAQLRAADLEIERVSGWNLALLPPAAGVRTLRRLLGRADAEHGDLQMPSPVVNRALVELLRGENRLLASRDLGPGVSLFVVARRPV